MKVDRKKNVITLGVADTRKWEDAGPRGYDFRRNVRDIAAGMLRSGNSERSSVEIYAAASAGGWMADQLSKLDID